jgi:hypothetical protein
VAHRQQAKALELRAVLSLSRLWHQQGTWLQAEEVVKINSFWRDIKGLVESDVVHCLFAVRLDPEVVLPSIDFTASRSLPVVGLGRQSVWELLSELTQSADKTKPVVLDPQEGWNALKDRLADDLSQAGAVLPIQLKIALGGLQNLRWLTDEAYKRAGGLRGLEAAYVEKKVADTASTSALTKMQVLTLLKYLADTAKLTSTADLKKGIIAGRETHTADIDKNVQQALDSLEYLKIIRKRPDPDSLQDMWLLD